MHSTDTHGYTDMIFAVSHLIGVTFAPRIKNLSALKLVSFYNIKAKLANKDFPINPAYYVNENKIKRNWDTILRLIVTIMLRKHRASTILKRLSAYPNQHPLQDALKEFGRVIKSIFVLKKDRTWKLLFLAIIVLSSLFSMRLIGCMGTYSMFLTHNSALKRPHWRKISL